MREGTFGELSTGPQPAEYLGGVVEFTLGEDNREANRGLETNSGKIEGVVS